jgi:predicted dinucleotide-utilizing enzyme
MVLTSRVAEFPPEDRIDIASLLAAAATRVEAASMNAVSMYSCSA